MSISFSDNVAQKKWKKDDSQQNQVYSILKTAKKRFFFVILLLCTGILFFQTWNLQNSCVPLVSFGQENCPVDYISLSSKTITLSPKETAGVSAKITVKKTVRNSDNLDMSLKWESQNPKIFSIYADDPSKKNGNFVQKFKKNFPGRGNSSTYEQRFIKGIQPGEAGLRVYSSRDPEKVATSVVTIEGIDAVKVHPNSLTVRVGSEAKLQALVSSFGDINTSVIWSTNSKIVKVSPEGLVQGVREGDAVVFAASEFDSSKTAQVPVHVQKSVVVDNLEIKPTSLNIWQGDYAELTVTVQGSGASNSQVEWKSNDENILRIDGQGSKVKVFALQPGEVSITATSEQDTSKHDSLNTVIKPPEVTNVIAKTNSEEIQLNVGDVGQLCAAVNGHGSYDQSLIWQSSDSNVASVDNTGTITAVKKGKTIISAISKTDPTKYAEVSLKIPRDVSWLAIVAGTIVTAGSVVLLVPPPVAIAMGTGAAFLVNSWQGSGFPGC